MKLSAVLIVKNEEANLARCLQSLDWVDEIIVVDTGSTDKTVAIAQAMGAKIFHIDWKGFGPARQYALEQAVGPWILSIDADEEVSPDLRQELQNILTAEPPHAGY
jgi:glycosyltransferase involved in cell wall biosynthesis